MTSAAARVSYAILARVRACLLRVCASPLIPINNRHSCALSILHPHPYKSRVAASGLRYVKSPWVTPKVGGKVNEASAMTKTIGVIVVFARRSMNAQQIIKTRQTKEGAAPARPTVTWHLFLSPLRSCSVGHQICPKGHHVVVDRMWQGLYK